MREGPSGKKFDDEWREIPDGTPRSVSVDLRPKSMEQMVAMYVSQAMALESRIKGEEGIDEAEDLEVDDEGDPEILTPYELHAMAAEAERDARRRAWLRENMRGKKPPAKPAAEGSGALVDQGGKGTVDLVKAGGNDNGGSGNGAVVKGGGLTDGNVGSAGNAQKKV